MLDRGGRVQDADLGYWREFLIKRAGFINDVLARVADLHGDEGERRRMTESLKAARGRLTMIAPQICVEYLAAWRMDRTRWRNFVAELPTGLSIGQALNRLGLANQSTIVRAGPKPILNDPDEQRDRPAARRIASLVNH